MFYIIKYLYCLLENIYKENADPRVYNLPMVYSPVVPSLIIVLYLAFVLHYGPKWMENRKAFELKYIMRTYNAIQVVANFLIFAYALPNCYGHKNFSFTCQPIDFTNTEPWMMRVVYSTYAYYLTKYLDLFDTVLIVLRKKNQQINFLHVYHHAGMVFGVYIHMTFMAGSHATMLGVINLFVHTVMYAYYLITSLRPVKESPWWKRYITQLQLMQFGYLSAHFLIVILHNTCGYPNLIAFVGFMQNIFMFTLFFEFYYRTYIKKPKSQQDKDSGTRSEMMITGETLKSR